MFDFIFSWDFLWWSILIIYVPACLGLVVVVLLQKGKGVGFAGAFGAGGGSDTVFGPRSAKSLPQKLTYTMAGLFMFLALIMSMLSGKVGRGSAPELMDADPSAAMLQTLEKGLEETGSVITDGTEASAAEAGAPEAAAPAEELAAEEPASGDAEAGTEEAPVQ